MLILFETPAGYALFSVDDDKITKPENIQKMFQDASQANKLISLKAFHRFENTTEALSAMTALVESKPNKALLKFLKKQTKKSSTQLGIVDAKLAGSIKEEIGVSLHPNQAIITELHRSIRTHLPQLISASSTPDLASDLHQMTLGLSHSLSRYKLKFSPDKVDVMIVQAVGLLDDLDKELNTYAMRVKEWYGWHFPELTRILTDNILYARFVKYLGMRQGVEGKSFETILTPELEAEVKEAGKLSMGTEISQEDLSSIQELCDQVIEISEYREQLYDYLRNRMNAIAPNLTVIVGELVGARLIAHAGSLMNLAKYPASTVQILGAEKALFRALKTKQATPKYGLIFHASLVGHAQPKNKGKVSRLLAARSALAIRVDALAEGSSNDVGMEGRAKVEARIRTLEEGIVHNFAKSTVNQKAPTQSHSVTASATVPAVTYNSAVDVRMEEDGKGKKRKRDSEGAAATTEESKKEKKEKKKEKKKKKQKTSQ